MKNLTIILSIFLLVGCTPYIAARHVSDPNISNDGWDLVCGGMKQKGRLTAKAGYCWNIRGGDMAEISIEWDLIE